MSNDGIYRLLEWPRVYRLAQLLLAPGVEKAIARKINQLLTQLPPAHRILDIGCGPSSRLWRAGLHPVGLDLSPAYAASFGRCGEPAVTGSAAALPFSDNSFDGIWNFALMHHLPDGIARQAVREMLRVTLPGGYIVILDWVLPEPAWRRLVAWIVQKLDRGRHMRHRGDLESLLLHRNHWIYERVLCSMLRYEGLFCVYLKKQSVDTKRSMPLDAAQLEEAGADWVV